MIVILNYYTTFIVDKINIFLFNLFILLYLAMYFELQIPFFCYQEEKQIALYRQASLSAAFLSQS